MRHATSSAELPPTEAPAQERPRAHLRPVEDGGLAAASSERAIPPEESFGAMQIGALGYVARVEGGLSVRTEHGERAACAAASCILAPEVGDLVLLAERAGAPDEVGALYVLAVLVRKEGAAARLRVEGAEVRLEAPDGPLVMSSPRGVDIVSGEGLRLVSKELDAITDAARVRARSLLVEARTVLARAGVAEGIFDSLETAAERLTARIGRSYRFVEQEDLTRAGSVDVQARETLLHRAKDVLTSARRLVRLDGEQIHLG